jgi:hypothetical protein
MRLLRRFAHDPLASTALLELASRLPPRCAPPLARRVLRTLTEVLAHSRIRRTSQVHTLAHYFLRIRNFCESLTYIHQQSKY